MKRRVSFIFISLFFFCLFAYTQNQQHYKIQVIDGVEYYVYTVQPTEGLYRISTNFGVSQEEITKFNPEIKDGLKSGQIIYIPKKSDTTPTLNTSTNKNNQTNNSNNTIANTPTQKAVVQSNTALTGEPHFYYHKIEKKQTLYSLSKQYELSVDDILKYNPQAAAGLREGEILRIPKAEDIYPQKQKEKFNEDFSVKYLIHNVEAQETLYSISRKYDVKVEDILKINPEFEVLQIGQQLNIPYYPALTQTESATGDKRVIIDLNDLFGSKDTTTTVVTPGTSSSLKIAFLLPFVLENTNDASVVRFVDFYAGAIKAIYEAKKKGVSIEVYTFDTGRSSEKIRKVFTDNAILKQVDLIIGPAYTAQVPVATQYAQLYKTKILIPFTSKVDDIKQNEYVFQFNPGDDVELDFIKQNINSTWNNANFVFVDINHEYTDDEGLIDSKNIKALLEEENKSFSTLYLNESKFDDINNMLSSNKKNLIIFNSDKYPVVQSYLKNLSTLSATYDILVYEQLSWQSQTTSRPKGIYISPFKPENEIKNLTRYNQDFTKLFGWEPLTDHPRFDILGYDLAKYFINILSDKENDVLSETELKPYKDAVQSQLDFKRISTKNGFVNQKLYISNNKFK